MAFRKPLDLTDGRAEHDGNVGLGLGYNFTTLCPMEHTNTIRDNNNIVNINRDNSMIHLNRDSIVHTMRDNSRSSMMDMIRDNMIEMDNRPTSMVNMNRDNNSMMNMSTIRDNSIVNRDSMSHMIRDGNMVNQHSDRSIANNMVDNRPTMVNTNSGIKIMNNMIGLGLPIGSLLQQGPVTLPKKENQVEATRKAGHKNQGKSVGNKNNYSEQSQQIVLNVYKHECRKNVKGAIARTAKSTGIHRLTISKIVKAGVPKTPKKPGSKKKRYAKLDNFMRDDIRQIIHAFYKDGQPPTIEMVYQKLNQKDAKFPYGKSHLRNIIKSLGFKHSRVNKRTVIMESPSGDINSFVLDMKGAT